MRQAWELAVSWRGELIRAELLQGRVRIDAGGPSSDDLPLPLEVRAPLLRAGAGGLELLSVAGATWSIDGACGEGGPIALAQGIARLSLGDLDVAVQQTAPVPPLPRFGPAAPSLLRATVFAAAYVMVGLGLITQPREPCACLQWLPAAPIHATAQVLPEPAPRRAAEATPRWLAKGAADGDALAQPRRRPRPAPRGATGGPARRSVRRVPAPLAVEPPGTSRFGLQLAELASANLGDEVVRLEDLDPSPAAAPAGEEGDEPAPARGDPRDGGHHGHGRGVGSCSGAQFQALVARHGRQTAIVACSTGVELGQPAPSRRRGHEVVLHEHAGSPLAPEVWSWSGRGH